MSNEKQDDNIVICNICSHHCRLREGTTGFCRARKNIGGENRPLNYGIVTGIALDPIEKKPLKNFFPGSFILSVGSFGCNLKCPFCQNHAISQSGEEMVSHAETVSPQELCDTALSLINRGNIGVAFTYNEPLICYEFVRDTAKLVKENGMKTAVVTNGSISLEILEEILPSIDAMNIDLKGFTEKAYELMAGDLKQTKAFIQRAVSSCHVELTSLIVPTINDSIEEMEAEAAWIATLSPDIPLHITRYFPMYQMTTEPPTDISLLYALKETAEKYLKNVYVGNV